MVFIKVKNALNKVPKVEVEVEDESWDEDESEKGKTCPHMLTTYT